MNGSLTALWSELVGVALLYCEHSMGGLCAVQQSYPNQLASWLLVGSSE